MLVTKLTFLTYFCIIYMITLLIIFFSRERIKNEENRIYVIMMFTNLVGLFLQLLSAQVSYKYNEIPTFISDVVIKLYLIYFIVFGMLLYWYLMALVNKPNKSKIISIVLSILLFASLIIFFMPMNVHTDLENLIFYSYGPAVTFSFIIGGFISFLLIITLIINYKNISKKKAIPLFLYLLLATISIVIQKNNPEIMIICFVESFLCFLMYHTIENPDLVMIEELTKTQKISEQTNNDKTNFIYTVSEDINNRLNNAEEVYNEVMELKPNEEISNYMNNLKDIITGARNMLKRTIDISDMDIKYLGLTNNKYNIRLLLDSVFTLKKNEVKEGVDYRLNITDDLPNELYGDPIKLKQMLITILDNSIRFTEKGFIELRVSSIIKDNICRLIISVEDSGTGIDIFKQNEIMNNTHDLDKEEIENLDNMNLNLKTVRKIVGIIGGTFNIDSNKYKGTTVSITIDQKIYEKEKSKDELRIEKYSKDYIEQKICAIVSMDKDIIKQIKNLSKKAGYKVEEYSVTKYLLDNIRNNKQYDAIFIDEYMEKIDARSFLSKVKEVENFNSKVFVISNNKNLKTKKELIDLGFTGIVNNPIEKEDILNKLKKEN